MSPSAVQEQIKIIRRATEKALQSKEATLEFLINAGIIKRAKGKQSSSKTSKEKSIG
jgi:hypothetical protein